ncbi:hypothetical protein DBV15_07578 [Temnothorax longispinosus]|uniref:Uncharacterized protein n=1 Tax=Temnothorax longispinosus TaxID=300112 RepID=A0A4S2L5E7_9HYME|nr:hypothetical protein DBV15_07578 [Temnothorax longispinosus]
MVRQRRLGSRKVDDRNSPLNPLSIRAAAPMTRRWFPAALRRREKEREREREGEREKQRKRETEKERERKRVRSIPREYSRKVRTRDTRVRRKGNDEGKVVVENVGSGSPTPKRNTRRSLRDTRADVCAYTRVCLHTVYMLRIRRGGEAVHLAARRGRMESWRTAAGGYGVKAVDEEERVVKWGCLGGRTRGVRDGEEGSVPGGERGVAVARPGSRRLLTRPVAQLDSTRLSARWQEAAARARGGRTARERKLSRGGGESIGAGEKEEDGVGDGGSGSGGAVGALLFAVEGGGSWGRKGGRRIDPDGAWLTADEAVTRDESRRDGRTEKAPSLVFPHSRASPLFRLTASGEASRWGGGSPLVGGWRRDGGARERYCLLPLRGLLAAKQYLDCTYTRPNSSAVAVAVPSMLLQHACRARARVQGVRKVAPSSLGRDTIRMDMVCRSTRARFRGECQTRSPREGVHPGGRRMPRIRFVGYGDLLLVAVCVHADLHLAEATDVRRLAASSLISVAPATGPGPSAFLLPTTTLLVVLSFPSPPEPHLNEPSYLADGELRFAHLPPVCRCDLAICWVARGPRRREGRREGGIARAKRKRRRVRERKREATHHRHHHLPSTSSAAGCAAGLVAKAKGSRRVQRPNTESHLSVPLPACLERWFVFEWRGLSTLTRENHSRPVINAVVRSSKEWITFAFNVYRAPWRRYSVPTDRHRHFGVERGHDTNSDLSRILVITPRCNSVPYLQPIKITEKARVTFKSEKRRIYFGVFSLDDERASRDALVSRMAKGNKSLGKHKTMGYTGTDRHEAARMRFDVRSPPPASVASSSFMAAIEHLRLKRKKEREKRTGREREREKVIQRRRRATRRDISVRVVKTVVVTGNAAECKSGDGSVGYENGGVLRVSKIGCEEAPVSLRTLREASRNAPLNDSSQTEISTTNIRDSRPHITDYNVVSSLQKSAKRASVPSGSEILSSRGHYSK